MLFRNFFERLLGVPNYRMVPPFWDENHAKPLYGSGCCSGECPRLAFAGKRLG
jgi:hypothetical protein